MEWLVIFIFNKTQKFNNDICIKLDIYVTKYRLIRAVKIKINNKKLRLEKLRYLF